MATMKKVYHSDPSHGWLAVKIEELKMLGIETEISNFSRIKGKTAYLEEDCDMPKFIKAAESKNITVEVKQGAVRDRSPIRSFRTYS